MKTQLNKICKIVLVSAICILQFRNAKSQISQGLGGNVITANIAGINQNNVGIGTTNPGSMLTVKTASQKYGITHTDGTVDVSTWVGTVATATSPMAYFGTYSNHPLHFMVNTFSRMCIDTAGKVMVGLSVADITAGKNSGPFKLFVNGGIKTDKLLVKAYAAWPDYVFHPLYNLKGLDEVENYILENNHLPGIPSSNEIAEGGIDLAEMQTRQMEKIEELTLYLIGLKKEIETLKASVQIANPKN